MSGVLEKLNEEFKADLLSLPMPLNQSKPSTPKGAIPATHRVARQPGSLAAQARA